MSTKPTNFFLTTYILFGILAVSTSSIFIRFAGETAPSLVIAAFRLTFAAFLLAPLALTRYWIELKHLSRSDLFFGILSGFFLSLHFATWISSLKFTSVASSVVLVTTTPLWVSLVSPFILKEKNGKNVIAGMLVALFGGILIGLADTCSIENGLVCPSISTFFQGKAFFGDLLSLCGAVMAAGYILIGRKLRSKMSLIPYIFLVYGVAAISLLVILFFSGEKLAGIPSISYFWIFLLALIPQLIGHSTFNWALGYLPASLVSITLLGEPIGSTILAFLLLHEIPGPIKLLGALFLLAGIITASGKTGN
ncbi:MAG: DMT family transporter [Chloroflexota bacterium]